MSGDRRAVPLYPGTAEERMFEIGNDLVRLGVCEKRGPTSFSFTQIFLVQLVAFGEIIRSTFLHPDGDPVREELRRKLHDLPYFEDKFKVPLLACHMTLKDGFKLDSVDDVLFAEYMAFCYEIIRQSRLPKMKVFSQR